MKLLVAFLFVLTISAGLVIQGQTTPGRTKPSAVSKPRNETIRICQGLAVPGGYVIIAYMTSSACPHGAYVLKKQDDYESSLAVNNNARQPAAKSAAPASKGPGKQSRLTSRAKGTSTQLARNS